jgi:hypothetical protein
MSKLGDQEFDLATAALEKDKLHHALRFSLHAENAFKNAMAFGKYAEARKLTRTLRSTLKAKADAKKYQMDISIARAESMKERELAKKSLQAKLAKRARMDVIVSKAKGVLLCR